MMVFRYYQTAVEQIIGREGETATFIKRNFVSLTLRIFSFAPRHLDRYNNNSVSITSFIKYNKKK